MNSSASQGFYRWQPSACLRVLGEDTLSFLQGQFTNDLHEAVNGGASYGLWLNQKGKVLADSFVRKISAREAWIVSYFSPTAVIRERLEAYIIADDVVIEDITDAIAGITRWGETVAPEETRDASIWSFRGRRMQENHREIIFPRSEEAALRAALGDASEFSAEQMERTRIVAGIPAVPADVGPSDLPNEGGLETVAISYTKGCYLGQEVMARLKSMGRVRRRLVRVRGASTPPARATAVFQAERKVGELRSVARDGSEWVGLAMVSLVQLQPGAGLALAPNSVPTITWLDTP